MRMCSGGRGTEGHEEIVYDGGNCPMCSMMEDHAGKIADLNDTIEAKDKLISDLENVEVGV